MLPKSQPNTTGLLLTLDRGIRVLEAIADGGGRASAKELSLGLAINLGTMYQLLRTLESNGYIVRLPGGTFRLGTRIGFLIDRFDLETAPPKQLIDKLHELRDVTEETVYISMAQGTDHDQGLGRRPVRQLVFDCQLLGLGGCEPDRLGSDGTHPPAGGVEQRAARCRRSGSAGT